MNLLAQLTEAVTPVGLLIGFNATLSAALGIVYRDCRVDRQRLWDEVRKLKQKVGE